MKKIFLLLFLLFIGCKHACLYDIQKTTPASCTQDGTQSFTCSICGDNFSNILPKTNHSYKTETVTEPTCSVMGVQKTSCQNCNYFYTSTIPLVEHNYQITEKTEPTCTTEGYQTQACKYCNDTNIFTIPATGHDKNIICSNCNTCNVSFSDVDTLYNVDNLDLRITFFGVENDNEYKLYSVMWTVANNTENSTKQPGVVKLFYMENNTLKYEFFTGIVNPLYYNDSKIFAYQWKLLPNTEFVCLQYIPNCDMEYFLSTKISPNSLYFK